MKKRKADSIKIKGWIYIPEDKCEADLTFRGMDWALSMWDLDEEIRKKIKYGHKFKSPDQALKWAMETLRDILESRNLSFDMIL